MNKLWAMTSRLKGKPDEPNDLEIHDIRFQDRPWLYFLGFASVNARSSLSTTTHNTLFTWKDYSQCHYCQHTPTQKHALHSPMLAGSSQHYRYRQSHLPKIWPPHLAPTFLDYRLFCSPLGPPFHASLVVQSARDNEDITFFHLKSPGPSKPIRRNPNPSRMSQYKLIPIPASICEAQISGLHHFFKTKIVPSYQSGPE